MRLHKQVTVYILRGGNKERSQEASKDVTIFYLVRCHDGGKREHEDSTQALLCNRICCKKRTCSFVLAHNHTFFTSDYPFVNVLATGSFILQDYYSHLAIHYHRDRVIKMIKYLQIFQTWPLQARRSTRPPLFARPYSNDNILLLPNSPPSLSPLHEPGLSLVRIEYLYGVWLGSRSLISKVTCWASAGSAAARGLAWDGVTWDILSPQCVLLFYWHRGLCFLAECLHRTQRRKSTSWLWSNYQWIYLKKK